MIRIEKYTPDEMAGKYELIHNMVFDQMDPNHAPGIVYMLFSEDTYAGFVSAYHHDKITLYLQKGGLADPFRDKGLSGEFWDAIYARMQADGIRYLIMHVQNINVPALISALKSGWVILGTHIDTAGKVYVRFGKGIED